MRNFLFYLVFLFFLCLLQTSFLVHFQVLGMVPNYVLFALLVINLVERVKDYSGIFAALFAGFFLDIFSGGFMGFWVSILLALSLLVKFVFKKNFRFILKKN